MATGAMWPRVAPFFPRIICLTVMPLRDSTRLYTQGDSDAVFLPWRGASCAKCSLLWHHFLIKLAILRTFS